MYTSQSVITNDSGILLSNPSHMQWRTTKNKNLSIQNADNHVELERLGLIRHPMANIEYIEHLPYSSRVSTQSKVLPP